MRRALAISVCACSAALGQSYVFDQLGPPDGSAIPNQGFVFGYFHHYSNPPVSFGNRACLDDFILPSRTRIRSVEVLLCGAPGAPINWALVPSWRVEIYSNPQIALNNNLTGDLLHQVVATPTSISFPFPTLNYAGQQLALIRIDVDVTLDTGMYWATILPSNSTSNGYGVQIGSNIGNAFATWQVLPGQTVIPLGHPGLALRIKGDAVSTCYPDCNGDGALNLSDFGCFQTKFALGDPYADCNGDGVRNLSDFGCFQTKFALGCP